MSYDNPRINDLSMTPLDIMVSLAEGNPGACAAMAECVKSNERVDPDCAFGAIGPLISLDTLDCYGSRIWMFYKDVCGQNVNKMLGLMRANQLGYVSASALSHAIDNRGAGIDIPALLARVKKRLPRFEIS